MATATMLSRELNSTFEENEIEQTEINAFVKAIPQVENYFEVLGKTGDGTFSSVFVAQLKGNQQKEKYALKNIIPTSKADRVANELKCLKEIGGSHNVIGVKAVIRNGQRITIVMPYIEHEKFTEYFTDMSVCEVKEYMKNLLIALKRVHEFDIIHRDIKPYALVDFGLAHPAPKSHESLKRELGEDSQDTLKSIENNNWGKTPKPPKLTSKKPWSPRRLTLVTNATKNSTRYEKCPCVGKPTVCSICLSRPRQQAPRAGTPGFRAPEVLLRHADQTTAIDIWSAGVILLSLLSARYPFFNAKDDITALAQIIAIFGVDNLKRTALRLSKVLTTSANHQPIDLEILCKELRKKSKTVDRRDMWVEAPSSAYDLLKKMLMVDPAERITAEEALQHPFFLEN